MVSFNGMGRQMRVRITSAGLFAVLLVLTVPSYSLPCFYGTKGFYRTVSAETPSAGTYSFFISALYQQAFVKDTLHFIREDSQIDTLLYVEDREHYIDGTIEFGLAITDNVELAMTMSYLVNAYQFDQVHIRRDYVGIIDMIWGPGDIRASVKYGRSVSSWITAGGMLWVGFPMGSPEPDTIGDYDGYWDRGDLRLQVRRPFLSTGKNSWGFLALASTRYGMFEANLNLGYSGFQQEYEDSIIGSVDQKDGALDFGLGVALNTLQVILFTEYSLRSFLSRKGDEGYSTPARFTGGIRLFDETGVYLDIVGELGLSDYNREETDPYRTGKLPLPDGVPGDWSVMMSLGFDSNQSVRTRSGIGRVVGTILDAETGLPLSGSVSFPGKPISPTVSDSVTGFFSAPVIVGTIIARAEVEGYIPSSATLVIPDDESVPVDFRLNRSTPPGGQVSGTVSDNSTGFPLTASISVEESDVSVVSSASGAFSMNLPDGTWSLRARSDGYIESVKTVSVSGGAMTIADFTLNPALESGETLSFASIYFNSGSDVIQLISHGILDEVVSLLTDNSGVTVEIVGHTDSDGSSSLNQDLSLRRARSVRNYLIQRGIAAGRLSTSGMGESHPIASNSTPQGKAENRRIDFIIR
ncbi:MAG: OmpA family protein [Candidatus Aegiribacteria sp.]|nr:OmpA family protein [Candidatus Aegiribacteria sp.]